MQFPSLPTFETRAGNVTTFAGRSSCDPANMADILQGGFVLKETDSETILFDDLHYHHGVIAASILSKSGLVIDPIIISEQLGIAQNARTPEHIDGLSGRFYQVHTLHATQSDVAVFNTAMIRRYQIDLDEHTDIGRRGPAGAFGAGHTLFMQPIIKADGHRLLVSKELRNAASDITRTTVGPDSTLVFPNGYNSQAPGPETLYTHQFESAQDASGSISSKNRYTSLSRIQAADSGIVD